MRSHGGDDEGAAVFPKKGNCTERHTSARRQAHGRRGLGGYGDVRGQKAKVKEVAIGWRWRV